MDGIVELRQILGGEGDDARRVEKTVEWLLARLSAEGVALLTPDESAADALSVRCSRGSLIGPAPLLAAELSRTGLPSSQGPIRLLAGEAADTFVCCPIPAASGKLRSALVLHGPAVDEAVRRRADDVWPAPAR